MKSRLYWQVEESEGGNRALEVFGNSLSALEDPDPT
jgi:hypothetical protein